jgi:hypothetical protein
VRVQNTDKRCLQICTAKLFGCVLLELLYVDQNRPSVQWEMKVTRSRPVLTASPVEPDLRHSVQEAETRETGVRTWLKEMLEADAVVIGGEKSSW